MYVQISKRVEGKATVLVVPARRERLPPVMVQGVERANLREVVKQLVADAVRPRQPVNAIASDRIRHNGSHIGTTGQQPGK